MPLYLNTNVNSLFAQNALNKSQQSMQVSLQRLSSGSRINSASDDATGLINATNYESQIRGNTMAIQNANDGISVAQINDGYMQQLTSNLERLRELAVQNANAVPNNPETTALIAENTRILGLAANDANAVIDSNGGLYTAKGAKPTLATAVNSTVANIDTDITAVANARASYAGDIATFQSAVNNMQSLVVNQSAAKSRIMDTDYAAETANMTKNQILQQAGTAMLAQANQLPNSILTLLK